MESIWRRIEFWLRENAPEIADGLGAAATDEELDETEQFLGVRLPADFRASYRLHNGQSPDSPWLIDCWEFLSLQRMRDEWQIWKGLLDGGDFDGVESDADGQEVRVDWWNAAWIPLTNSGGGDHHCLDLAPGPAGHEGQVIEMWHDDGARPVVASSFGQWLSDFADALEADEFVLSDEYGGLCSRDEL